MKFKTLFFLLSLIHFISKAQTSPQLNAANIKSELKKLNVVGRVLYVAAHPDDENTRLLTYLAKEKLVETGYLSLTRGDGGQNLIGKEQSEELGLIRTQELLAARKIDGAEQFFTRANDFGFSKTAKETFTIWDKDQILSDVVYIIRKFKPDVIITRFPLDERAGHGHHAASSILAQEAFSAAADPERFPEQLKELKIWQARRILWNNYSFGDNDNTSDEQLKVDVGSYNFLLGKSYGEIAAESRSMHKSQGFGSAKQRGKSIEYFSSWKGGLPKSGLFDDIEISWKRVNDSKILTALIDDINQKYNLEEPAAIVPDLLNLYKALEKIPDNPYKKGKINDLKNIILACTGTWVEAYSTKPAVAINTPFHINVTGITQYPNLSIATDRTFSLLPVNEIKVFSDTLNISEITQPYWLMEPHEIGQYVIAQQTYLQSPAGPEAKYIDYKIKLNGVELDFSAPVVYKYADQVRGEVYEPLIITPPVTANLDNNIILFPTDKPKEIRVRLKAFKDSVGGSLILNVPDGWKVTPEKQPFEIAKAGQEIIFVFTVNHGNDAISGILRATITIGNETYHKGINKIDYGHIPSITYFTEASAKLVKLNLQTTAKKNIGYIAGAGDLIPEMLEQIGYTVSILNEENISNTDLSAYSAIITGIRAYNTNDFLKAAQPLLLKYVENGGVLLVQYNVSRPLLVNNIGPYPFAISRNRVTEENATIKFLQPQNKALNYPNKITSKDFEGWIQERGLYFVTDVDKRYNQPLQMKDTDEDPSAGSLIIADYGKGKFVYTGLSFFRELPAGVTGAYRLFVNLISK